MCDFDLGKNPIGKSACNFDVDCCAGPEVNLEFACPSDVYPNDVTCESGVCVHAGCATDSDCLFPGFVCATISGVGHCVAPCDDIADCADLHNMPDSSCETVGSYKFCMQEQP